MLILILFAFISGIVTILSPCILPVLPIVLSGSVGGARKPLGVILGFAASFTVFTLVLSTVVQLLNIPPDALRIIAVVLIITFGLVMVIPKLKEKFELFASRMTSNSRKSKNSNGFIGGVIIGSSLGLIWTPCVGPIIASVISLAVSQNIDSGAVLIILSYSLGTSIPMFAIMIGGRNLIKRFPKLINNSGKIQQVFGILMILVGLTIALGLDRKFQSAVLKIFPNYGSGLTVFESIDPVKKAIDRRYTSDLSTMTSASDPSFSDKLPDYVDLKDLGLAPAIVTTGEWFNTEGKSLKLADLKGKVVLVDFWTFSCINCVRTLPYLKSWYETYKDQGFVIIGVHSPEFAFERNQENVKKAIKDLGVVWPVVLDNEFLQWRAYNNRYWPAEYFIDAKGRIRYTHFGEGEYETSEKVIRALLKEAGNTTLKPLEEKSETDIKAKTAEIYLGFSRTEGFISEKTIIRNKPAVYRSNTSVKNGEWSLDGTWTINNDYIIPQDSGNLKLGFNAKNVFLVIEPENKNGRIEVFLDGKPVANGVLFPTESRVYQLIKRSTPAKGILNLKVKGKLRLFAFTFG